MGLGEFVTFVVIGVIAGWLAGVGMREGGYGLNLDIVLGVAGSGVTSIFGYIVGATAGASVPLVALLGLVGAALAIVAQRKIWPAPPVVPVRVRTASRP